MINSTSGLTRRYIDHKCLIQRHRLLARLRYASIFPHAGPYISIDAHCNILKDSGTSAIEPDRWVLACSQDGCHF